MPICTELYEELKTVESPLATAAVVDNGDGVTSMGHKSIGHVFERWLPRRRPVAPGGQPVLVSPHMLRRTFATELYVRGVDILTIQRLLGHSDPRTTLRYIAASSEKW